MELNKIPKNELELLSYTEIAKMYLKENKTTKNTAELFRKICNLLELSEDVYVDSIADFFQSLSTSKEFILLENGEWDLKSNHKVKIDIDDIYDETSDETEENENESDEDITEDELEENDLDLIDDTKSFIDDDDDDDLANLTIINDEELEE